MVSVIKVTSFAWNYRDGKLVDKPELLTNRWTQKAVLKMPTLLEYLGFLFFFPTFLAGFSTCFSIPILTCRASFSSR